MLKGVFICGSGIAGDNRAMRIPARTTAVGHWPRTRGGCRWLLAGLLIVPLVLGQAHAGGKDDHERARAAVQAGQVLGLAVVLERLQRSHPGQVLELELEQEKGRWIYEIRLVQPDGQLLRLTLDAATARVLEVRRK